MVTYSAIKIRKRNVIHTLATSANKTLIELVNMP